MNRLRLRTAGLLIVSVVPVLPSLLSYRWAIWHSSGEYHWHVGNGSLD